MADTQRTISSAAASTEFGEHVAANAIDGTTATKWTAHGGGKNQTLLLDLGSEQRCSRFRVYTDEASTTWKIHLWGSNDGIAWTEVIGAANEISTIENQWAEGDFAPETFRYWLMLDGSGASGWMEINGVELWELETDPTPAPTDQTIRYVPYLHDTLRNGATIAESSSAASTVKERAFRLLGRNNDNNSNRWVSDGGAGQWLRVDFGEDTPIEGLTIVVENSKTYRVEYSDNDTDWTQHGSDLSSVANKNLDQTIDGGSEETHRYWRIYSPNTWVDILTAIFYTTGTYGGGGGGGGGGATHKFDNRRAVTKGRMLRTGG